MAGSEGKRNVESYKEWLKITGVKESHKASEKMAIPHLLDMREELPENMRKKYKNSLDYLNRR